MLLLPSLADAACAACRLRSTINSKQLARSRRPLFAQISRRLHVGARFQSPAPTAVRSRDDRLRELERTILDLDAAAETLNLSESTYSTTSSLPFSASGPTPEEVAYQARQQYGDALPENYLNAEEYLAYERLYGKPLRHEDLGEVVLELDHEAVEEGPEEVSNTKLLKEARGGSLQEVDSDRAELGEDEFDTRVQGNDDINGEQLQRDIELAMAGESEDTPETNDEGLDDRMIRTHPFTVMNRFGTSPSTIQLPKASLVDPITFLLSGMPIVHLGEAAHRIFGGVGLPYSAATPAAAKTKQQKPIALDASQSKMSEIEGDVYLATLMPAIYASVTSILVETRKRMGTAWAEKLVHKAQTGDLRILDAGGAGAGILAVREMLKAESERMYEDRASLDSSTEMAPADGRIGGAGVSPPLGSATVLTGSDALRSRSSQLLENTTFIPRLPDYLHTETAKEKGKFDIIIAPHTLWQLQEDYMRKAHVQNLWSLLSNDGGVLLMVEKGIPRGFELMAAAREMLLDTRIASPGSDSRSTGIEDSRVDVDWENGTSEPLMKPKDKGMIIAPCTNHETCPMYKHRGLVKGRKDICHFEQRYIRPGFLQRVLGAQDKNHEDVKFSYLSVMRGEDLRRHADAGSSQRRVHQDQEATQRAFEGYEEGVREADSEADALPSAEDFFNEDQEQELGELQAPHSLSLPRAILPPLKRRGHVILDLCTPSGTLERWTVPRSFSKQAFRDARKSSWGDLWALGAKTRIPRSTRVGKHNKPEGDAIDVVGRVKDEVSTVKGGQLRGRKQKGIRDKRDKKATGNGRRKKKALGDV